MVQKKRRSEPIASADHNSVLELKNPHAVRAAIHHRPEDVQQLVFVNEPQGLWIRIAEQAEQAKITIKFRDQKEAQAARAQVPKGNKQERSGHAFAQVLPRKSLTIETLLALPDDATSQPTGTADSSTPRHGLWLALDSLTDPHNVGAIFRTASFFGVRGIVMTRNASAPMNATVYDIAAGGVETVPFAVETNLNRTLKYAQRNGLWNLGTSEHAERSIWQVDRGRPWLLALGNEQRGLKRLLLENCDDICCIPPVGEVGSLNVSVAAGVMLSALTAPAL